MKRCYRCDERPARYEAGLDDDTTPVVLLCDDCAAYGREIGAVIWIRTMTEEG